MGLVHVVKHVRDGKVDVLIVKVLLLQRASSRDTLVLDKRERLKDVGKILEWRKK